MSETPRSDVWRRHLVSGRLDEAAARLPGNDQEMANSLKLIAPEGDVDIILAGPVTREAAEKSLGVDGGSIWLQSVTGSGRDHVDGMVDRVVDAIERFA